MLVFSNDLCRATGSGGVLGSVAYYYGPGCNGGVASNPDIFNYADIRPNVNIVTNCCRCTFVCANGKELADIYIVANCCSTVDYNSYTMSNVKAVANFSITWYLNTIL